MHEFSEAHATDPVDRVATVALLTGQLMLDLPVSILPHINGIVDHVVLEVEPEHAVVRLRVQASLSSTLKKLISVQIVSASTNAQLLHKKRGAQELKERVTVLRRELDSEVQEFHSGRDVEVRVGVMLGQVEAGTFAPHLA